jgi:membrane protein required for colicin V production
MMMTTLDWIIIAIITLSTVVSLWRGATREILSLITWVAAAYLAFKFAAQLDGLFIHFFDAQSFRFAAGFILIFLVVIIIGGVLSYYLSRLMSFAGLTVLDRLLGILFGAARGVLIIAIAVVLANYTTIPRDNWWKESQLLPQFEGVATSLTNWIDTQGFIPQEWKLKPAGEPAAIPQEHTN